MCKKFGDVWIWTASRSLISNLIMSYRSYSTKVIKSKLKCTQLNQDLITITYFPEGRCHQMDYVHCIIHKTMKTHKHNNKKFDLTHYQSLFYSRVQSCRSTKQQKANVENKLVLQLLWINEFAPCLVCASKWIVMHKWRMLMSCMILTGECWGPLWTSLWMLFYKKNISIMCSMYCSCQLGW